ncbi:undecaprenyl-phosphate glucose phosphotransferase [Aeoliella mucimassa]|uniref:UDP-glucose:undecaprenyl-phosphate glucose-1-phosphate transferase n=1 Tax=Aeoliella mucimassa TaxID=2527972 RepID=A0A518AJS4_9BACT|nr:undecaprenyl-phosphate glucose phosphotransferase [Aeoliella mucimassa]QDU54924.1 UDP-glucose:undecaprenyl-phosphate glucose-1-phosphate transferase [Aeoliella mucimassa]
MSPVSRGIAEYASPMNSLHRLIDGILIAICMFSALDFTPGMTVNEWLALSAAAILVHQTVSELSGLYRSWRGASLRRELSCILLTWAYAVPVLLGLGMLTNFNAHLHYHTKLYWVLATPLAMLAGRVLLRKLQQFLRSRGFNTKTVAIVGINELGIQLARNLQYSPGLGLRVAGFFDDRPRSRTAELPEELGPHAGSLSELVTAAKRGSVDIVYITFPMRAEKRIQQVLAALGDTTASVYIVPDFFVFNLLHARWTNINGLPAVSVFENPLYGVDGLLKRMSDLVLGSAILAVAALPMMLIAAAVKLTSRGPVFFRQKRYGINGQEIRVWKFRSMTCCDNGDAVRQATKNDKRVTRVGAVLRRTSLDELPQLFNVLEGTMSLVGPRPHASAHNEQYRPLIDGYMLRHKVKPGITGLAQVMGFRGETETLDKMEGRIRFDHQYIRDWSLWMDMKILFRTFAVVLKQDGAY